MYNNATIILEGGANRGVFTAGVLDFLMENNIYIKNIIGVSAGAANALNYSSHQIGRSRKTIVIDKDENRYINKKKFLSSKILDMEMLFDIFPNKTFPYDYQAFIDNQHYLDIAVTNCKSGECEFHNIDAKNKDLTACIASCSMPFAAPIVPFNNGFYVDGSVSNSIPLDRAFVLGEDKIIIVLTQKKGYRKEELKNLNKFLINLKYGKYPKLVKNMIERPRRYNKRLEEIERKEANKEIFVIRPQVDTISHLEQDVEVLNDFYNHGRQVINSRFKEFKDYLNIT